MAKKPIGTPKDLQSIADAKPAAGALRSSPLVEEHRIIIPLTVRKILDEEIARKLA
jgi:hypothetical protein